MMCLKAHATADPDSGIRLSVVLSVLDLMLD